MPVTSMRQLVLASMLGGMLALGACAASQPPTSHLRFFPATAAPAHAKVTIDDVPVGSLKLVAERGVGVPPGKHRVTIEADGYLPWDQDVDAGAGGLLLKIDVLMVKTPE